MKKKRRTFETFSLSFLDVVSCGFGAIVLLLVIIKISDPIISDQGSEDLKVLLKSLDQEHMELEQQSISLSWQLDTGARSQVELQAEISALAARTSSLNLQLQNNGIERIAQRSIVEQLQNALQTLNEEMRLLQAPVQDSRPDSPIGGIPVDSEYVIFIIDTSGSMQQFAWFAVRQKMREILEIYPQVKGIQVMNDMGEYMFSQYSGRWIRDTPARRRAILKRLSSWMPFSNSSPVEGVTAAIKRFHDPDKKISIYILGDDFSRGSIQGVVDTIDHINRSLRDGSRQVRVHAVGFPVLFGQPGAELRVARFAALMRTLAENNDGSFVGLTDLNGSP